MKEKYYAIYSIGKPTAKSLAQRSKRLFGMGYVRGNWAIVGPMFYRPWGWRYGIDVEKRNRRNNMHEALPNLDMFEADSPGEAAEKAGVKF